MQYWMQSEIYATIQCLTHCITLGVVISGQNNIKKITYICLLVLEIIGREGGDRGEPLMISQRIKSNFV